jgi:hypothetical protein
MAVEYIYIYIYIYEIWLSLAIAVMALHATPLEFLPYAEDMH